MRVFEECWFAGISYEHCCSPGEIGVGNPRCWPAPGNAPGNVGLSYSFCCTPPTNSFRSGFRAPLTYSHKPLGIGEGPPTESTSAALKSAERLWATGHNIDDFTAQRWRIAKDPALFAKFRSKEASSVPMGQDFNHVGILDDNRIWQVRMVVEAIPSFAEGRYLLQRLPKLASAFDSFGSPRKGSLFSAANGIVKYETSFEFAMTMIWCLMTIDSVRFDGTIEGQAPDGSFGGLPHPHQLSKRAALPWDVVEVGAGWGWVALMWQLIFRVRSYSIIDLPAAQAVQGLVTRQVQNSTAFPSTHLTSEEVLPRYDLFISFSAYTELAPEVRLYYLHKVIIRSRRGIILDNSHSLKRSGRHNESNNTWFEGTTGLDLVKVLKDVGFTVKVRSFAEVMRAPLPEHIGVGLMISWVNTTQPYPGKYLNIELAHDWRAAERLVNHQLYD